MDNKYQYTFDSEKEAEEFCNQCKQIIEKYGVLTNADILDILGKAAGFEDMRIGWFSLDGVPMCCNFQKQEYTVYFPNPVNLSTSKGETLSNVKRHAEICKELTSLYERKNHDYGDAFHDTFLEEGFAMARVRLSDKLNRFKTLSKDTERAVTDESIRDTLIDLANYAIMTIMEMDKNDKNN